MSAAARQSWDAAINRAQEFDDEFNRNTALLNTKLPMSLDFNHRKQLGTLAELWAIVTPHASKFEVIILSLEQLNGLCGEFMPRTSAELRLPIADDAADEAPPEDLVDAVARVDREAARGGARVLQLRLAHGREVSRNDHEEHTLGGQDGGEDEQQVVLEHVAHGQHTADLHILGDLFGGTRVELVPLKVELREVRLLRD